MDVKCVRVLRAYDQPPTRKNGSGDNNMILYIDDPARYSLSKDWGSIVEALGRRRIKVEIQSLLPIDQDGFIARASQEVIDALYIEYGEEILLY